MKRDKITRRKFVAGTTGAAVGAMIVPRHVLGGPGYQPPSDKLNVAVIGCGGQGAADATELVIGGENIKGSRPASKPKFGFGSSAGGRIFLCARGSNP